MNNYQVNRAKWQALNIFEQMGNIYSEVGRTFTAKRLQNSEAAEQAAIRALDLFDATAEGLSAQKSPKLREVLRAREQFCSEYFAVGQTTLDNYFMQFAIAARLRSAA